MPDAPPKTNELLIASLTPQNLERGELWFSENALSIKKAVKTHAWWRENAFFIETDLVLSPILFVRRLADFGYERGGNVTGKGVFAVRGGFIELWPINTKKPYIIEFHGNAVSLIFERPDREEKTKPRRVTSRKIDSLPEGSYVVHVDHGVGIFRGDTSEDKIQNSNIEIRNKFEIKNSNIQNVSDFGFRASDFFVVEYAPPAPGRAPDRLFVPIGEKDRLTPYVGFETPRVHRLGGSFWQTTKRKIKKDAEKFARELLEIYAKRNIAERPAYEGDRALEEEIREAFPFDETEDQLKAEADIARDLSRTKPMDRILVGDVGFGKTEIALRAALRAIASGRQVALLAPTTILAMQHARTFEERLSRTAIETRLLARVVPEREQKKTLDWIQKGTIDCVIGTHRMLSKDISFKNLGLVIIDEEQRFGVKHKEHFKEFRADLDVLSLSATPIPRTLSLALARLRDMSVLETPPPERKPIHTFVLPYSEKMIKEAILAELSRNGQVYFLHNRIETIGHAREKLEVLLAKAGARRAPKIGIIHGRMDERELIRAMDGFRKKEINILLATTIIENGLDISSANTLIVDDATRLGLAQAHQLRGRIGRGKDEAFAYFLYAPKHLTEKSLERLEALKEYAELGAGYAIALRDLEIRGAGNILGKEQAGAINKVGLNLYCQMLSEAVEELKGNQQ